VGVGGWSSRCSPSDQEQDDELLCILCMEQPKDTCLLPCGHAMMCGACTEAALQRSNECPVCRAGVLGSLAILGH
jgi:hypothetical protein